MSDWNRILGGSPGTVIAKLVFLSLLVGAFLAFFDITPFALVKGLADWLHNALDLSVDTLVRIGGWLVAGAVIVLPLWLISRLLARK